MDNKVVEFKFEFEIEIKLGDGVAQYLSVGLEIPKTRGSNPVRRKQNMCESFSESKCYADSLSVCITPVYTRTHRNNHVRTLKIM